LCIVFSRYDSICSETPIYRTHTLSADALIVAGDVSHDLEVLRRTLHSFKDRFGHVFFVPGNHELWIREGEHSHSVHKFQDVLRLCESLGVCTGPEVIGFGADRVCVVPLFSWYSRPADGSDSLYRPRPVEEPAESMWADDYLVKWPSTDGLRPVPYFLNLNAGRVNARYAVSRISFSHFLPRQDLMFAVAGEDPQPGPDPPRVAFNFSAVAGSTSIEQQIRQLGSQVHVYGHQHRNRSRCHDGIRYVSNCLGYPDERRGRPIQVPRRFWKRSGPHRRETILPVAFDSSGLFNSRFHMHLMCADDMPPCGSETLAVASSMTELVRSTASAPAQRPKRSERPSGVVGSDSTICSSNAASISSESSQFAPMCQANTADCEARREAITTGAG
jgi:hypothetical protein